MSLFCLKTQAKRAGICDKQASDYENVLLAGSPLLEERQPQVANTAIQIPGTEIRTTMHSLQFGPVVVKADKLPVVFVHGFGACSVMYREMLAHIGETRRVYAVDMLGMGLSGKPSINYSSLSTDQTIRLFIDSIDAWATEVGLERFHLIGHSLGGYICSHFAQKKPQRVVSLTLLSPGGMVKEPDDFQARLKAKKGMSVLTKVVKGMWWTLNKGWISTNTMGRFLPTNCMVKNWSKDRFLYQDPKKFSAAVGLVSANLSHPSFSGDILPKIFGYRAYSPKPVVDFGQHLETALEAKVLYVFGEKDWMDKYAFRQEHTKLGLRGRLHIQKEGTHHFPCLQPQETARLIVEFLQSL